MPVLRNLTFIIGILSVNTNKKSIDYDAEKFFIKMLDFFEKVVYNDIEGCGNPRRLPRFRTKH